MEEEGEEEEVKKKKLVKTKPKLKPKPKLAADGTEITVKKTIKKKAPTISDVGSSKLTKKDSEDDKKDESKVESEEAKQSKEEVTEKSEDTTETSSSKKDGDEDMKIGKSVSFSPSTEFIEGKETKKFMTIEPIEAVIVKKIDPESDKKHVVELTTVFLNSPPEKVAQEIKDKEESANVEKPTEDNDDKTKSNIKEEITNPEEVKEIGSAEVKIDELSTSQTEVVNEIQVEGKSDEAADVKDNSPIYPLPPRNAELVSPDLPPKDESLAATAKKRLGVPIMSAMKKMAEGPKNLMDTIRSKMDSKSPTRKEKKEKADKASKEEEPPEKKPKDDAGSPPLPPRNKPEAGSPKPSLKNEGSSASCNGSPKLPPRNNISPILSSKQYFCDDPKRFSSLQPKRHMGANGRVRESSLPPPSRPSVEDGRSSPKIPPKTWMWEEVKRNKLKGGYPWTHLYKGSFDEAKWKEIMEHEYEYVDPRPELLRPEPVRPQAGDRLSPRSSPRVSPRATPEPEKPKSQRRFIRIRDTDQVIIPLHGSSDEEHNPDRYEDPDLIGQEEIGLTPDKFRPSPSPSPNRRQGSPEPKLSEKLRTSAGNFGSKIRKISIPDKSKFRLPDKPKFISDIQQIKLPETPKFLTEKPKFLTEKPKFLTEKPKFLTEKPKFLTEKPKFLTEKPKFLTEKPKFLTEKPKFLTEKPKFLSEKPKFLKEGIKFPDTSKFKLPERPKMPSIKLPKSRRTRPKRETSVKSEFGSEKNIFQTIKARTYPRFLNKRKRQGIKKTTPPPGQSKFDSESLPSTPRSKRNEKWADVYKEKKIEDEVKVTSYTNGESFHERYSKREAKRASSSSMADSDREQVSSGSSTQRHRAGVIEEIDSDEFFVRVKGISREDVQVSNYLSTEIREAFRSPKNALASLDKEEFDDDEPLPPHRSKKPKEYPRQDFNTFPMRPSRGRKDNGTMEKPPRRFRSKNKPGSLPSLHRDQEFEMEVEEEALTKMPPTAPKRRKSAKDLEPDDHWTTIEAQIVPDEGMAQEEIKVEYDIPPVAPVRKSRSRGTSLADEDRTSRGAESIKSEMQIDDDLNDDFRMEDDQREKEVKEPLEEKTVIAVTEIIIETSQLQETPAYSNVSKSRPPRPPPPEKETEGKTLPRLKSKIMGHRHMQQLQTWKNQSVDFFFTYPRKAMKSMKKSPKRPVRNYSTIGGPIRPPRRHKVFREPVYVDADVEPVDSIPFIDDDEKIKPSRSEEAIGGMKGRPLPPPPRPPLPRSDDFEDRREQLTTEELNILNSLASQEPLDEPLPPVPSEEIITKQDDRMQSRPLPPPPRRKRGSSSSDRKRGSTPGPTPLNDLDGREYEEEPIDARMTIDITEPITVLSVQQAEPIRTENDIVRSELPAVRPVETLEQAVEAPQRKITAEISQQTSLDIAEITVSVQTDPLPEGAIVEDTDEAMKSKAQDSDEEPTIEKYLEKYGTEIKMLGRQVTPLKTVAPTEVSKPQPQKPAEQEKKIDPEVLENIEKEIIPVKLNDAESDRNIDKSETKVVEKSMPVEKEGPKEPVVERFLERVVVPERSEPPKPEPTPLSFPDRLHLTHLDVDNLNVSSLKASQILVSDLTGQTLQVTELTSRGGNLVVSGMEFPPSFIQNLASEISAKVEEKIPPPQQVVVVQQPQPAPEVSDPTQAQKPEKKIDPVQKQSQTEKSTEAEKPPGLSRPESPHGPQKITVVTAPPRVVVQTAAESVTQPSPETGILLPAVTIPTPRTTRNKGKKSESARIVDDSEDELASTLESSPKPSSLKSQKAIASISQAVPSTSKAGPSTSQATAVSQQIGASGLTARQLLIELLKIWSSCVKEGFSACSNTVGSMFPEGQKRRDAQKAACVLFVIIVGLFALGFGTDNTVHYHHWDYMPPRM